LKNRLKDSLLFFLAPRLAAWTIRALGWSIRPEFLGEEHPGKIWEQGDNLILAFWHEQLFLMVVGYRGPGTRIMISSSKDGELIARVMDRFGQGTVRGSSTRGGRAAFRQLVELARDPIDFAITPDGPKGPRRELKEGVVQLARITGRPVVPMAFVCSGGHRFSSWDRFLLPRPFCRGVFSFGEPVRFHPGESPADFGRRLHSAMEQNERRACRRLEEHGVSAV
jgi:lysophospholipid acyltransferase (LPLAT)-like uncharacterized protein